MAMADTNRRELPTSALLRLVPLAVALPPPWSNAPPDPAPTVMPAPALPPLPDVPAAAALQHRLRICEGELLRTSRALARAAHPVAQARRLLAVLPAMAATLPPDATRAHRQLPFLEANARDYLRPEPTAARALLTIRVAALHHEIGWLRDWLPAA